MSDYFDGVSLDLEKGQTVCDRCRLVYWRALGYCPTCRAAERESA